MSSNLVRQAGTQTQTPIDPSHVLGTAYWNSSLTDAHGRYRCLIGQKVFLLKLINDSWYLIEQHYDSDLRQHIYRTQSDCQVPRDNELSLGWWPPEDETHLAQLPVATAPLPIADQQEGQLEYIEEDIVLPDLLVPIVPDPVDPIEELTNAFRRLTPIHIDLTLLEESTTPVFVPALPIPTALPPPIVSMAAVPLTTALNRDAVSLSYRWWTTALSDVETGVVGLEDEVGVDEVELVIAGEELVELDER
ncbi:hypothetical protein EDB84DRAFT_1606142 [Lactarius hengduanensis]|nr:hypothetical protein EDB84DRAFT_1606142 [Lactarius hengduanensis]